MRKFCLFLMILVISLIGGCGQPEMAGRAVGTDTSNIESILEDTGTTLDTIVDAILVDTAAMDTAAEVKALAGTVYTPQVISCATTDFTASADDIFLVAGGPIAITDFFGICTTVAAGSPGDMKIWCDATTGDQDRDFSTTVTVDTLGAGDSVRFTNAIDEGVLDFTPNVGAGQPLSWICPIGTIEQSLTSTGTGAVTWYMVYIPLSSSSVVTAAP